MKCDEVASLMSGVAACENTEHGARYVTHCLYPSFEQVAVYVSKWGDGYRVTDAGGATSCVLRHGRDDASLQSAFKKVRQRFGVATLEGAIVAEADADWLPAAVLAVANASASAASMALKSMVAAAERALSGAIYEQLLSAVPEKQIARDYEYVGSSGRRWEIDYAVLAPRPILVKGITPHPNSIFANHTLFGDVGSDDGPIRFAAYERPLKPEDAALMRQVAELVPVASLGRGAHRELIRAQAH